MRWLPGLRFVQTRHRSGERRLRRCSKGLGIGKRATGYPYCQHTGQQKARCLVTHSSTVLVRDQSPSQHTLHRVIHPHTCLKRTESPKPHLFAVAADTHRQRQSAHSAHETAEFPVNCERGILWFCRGGWE